MELKDAVALLGLIPKDCYIPYRINNYGLTLHNDALYMFVSFADNRLITYNAVKLKVSITPFDMSIFRQKLEQLMLPSVQELIDGMGLKAYGPFTKKCWEEINKALLDRFNVITEGGSGYALTSLAKTISIFASRQYGCVIQKYNKDTYLRVGKIRLKLNSPSVLQYESTRSVWVQTDPMYAVRELETVYSKRSVKYLKLTA